MKKTEHAAPSHEWVLVHQIDSRSADGGECGQGFVGRAIELFRR
jgi:hypothetical protein